MSELNDKLKHPNPVEVSETCSPKPDSEIIKEIIRILGVKRDADTTTDEIPNKLQALPEFIRQLLTLTLQGTDKYKGAQKDVKENIDIFPDIFGIDGFWDGVLFDVSKRIIRLRNQRRERDIVKIALWMYILYMKFYYKK